MYDPNAVRDRNTFPVLAAHLSGTGQVVSSAFSGGRVLEDSDGVFSLHQEIELVYPIEKAMMREAV